MNIDWLEPVIKERTEVLCQDFFDNGESHRLIMELLESKRNELSSEFLLELESLVISHTREIVYCSYRSGVDESLFK